MKVIDLLNKIANGEEVPNFWWNGCIHEVQKEYGTNKYSIFDTYCKKYKKIELEDLNDEIKFLEEEKKIPEKLKILNANEHSKEVYYENYSKEEISLDIETLQSWVNRIIDYLDYLKSKGDE